MNDEQYEYAQAFDAQMAHEADMNAQGQAEAEAQAVEAEAMAEQGGLLGN